MHPDDLVGLGVGANLALEVDVVALGQVGGVQIAPQAQLHLRSICGERKRVSELGREIRSPEPLPNSRCFIRVC